MAKYNLLLPRMGESVSEATIVKWNKEIGDTIDVDDTIIEIATDKVDSDVPSPVAGKLIEKLFSEEEVAQVGDVIAVIEIEGDSIEHQEQLVEESDDEAESALEEELDEIINNLPSPGIEKLIKNEDDNNEVSGHFLSPLVKSIAQEEGIPLSALKDIKGSGLEGRITKQDILHYVEHTKQISNTLNEVKSEPVKEKEKQKSEEEVSSSQKLTSTGDEIIEMDRMRKFISTHMTDSLNTSAHVTSFLEADVTNIVKWRDQNKVAFLKKEGTKITYTPIFIEAVAKAIRDFPMINISVQGTQIIKKKNINVGMAAALPSGNLIVPVIKNVDQLSLVGISKAVNDLAERSRSNSLLPDEVRDGTFTITNIGSFGNLMGTPIINQPQVAILAVGAIVKKPAVVETKYGDMIAIRHKMYLSLSYDHRVVDGALGGMFIRRVADYLEEWDVDRLV